MAPDEYCQQKAAASGSSFYYSFLFLPPDQRRAITALYAFCREVDDAVDEAVDPGVARAKLAWWRGEIHDAFDGSPHHPVARALAPVVRTYHLAESQLVEIIDGMQMDLDYNRYPDFATLEVYCHRVAGVVGLFRRASQSPDSSLQVSRALRARILAANRSDQPPY
jgi:phytoene synthase